MSADDSIAHWSTDVLRCPWHGLGHTQGLNERLRKRAEFLEATQGSVAAGEPHDGYQSLPCGCLRRLAPCPVGTLKLTKAASGQCLLGDLSQGAKNDVKSTMFTDDSLVHWSPYALGQRQLDHEIIRPLQGLAPCPAGIDTLTQAASHHCSLGDLNNAEKEGVRFFAKYNQRKICEVTMHMHL